MAVSRLDKIENRLDALENSINNLTQRLTVAEQKITTIDLAPVLQQLQTIAADVQALRDELFIDES